MTSFPLKVACYQQPLQIIILSPSYISKEFYGLSQTDGRQPDWNPDLFSNGSIRSARRLRDAEHLSPAPHLKRVYPSPVRTPEHPRLYVIEKY